MRFTFTWLGLSFTPKLAQSLCLSDSSLPHGDRLSTSQPPIPSSNLTHRLKLLATVGMSWDESSGIHKFVNRFSLPALLRTPTSQWAVRSKLKILPIRYFSLVICFNVRRCFAPNRPYSLASTCISNLRGRSSGSGQIEHVITAWC